MLLFNKKQQISNHIDFCCLKEFRIILLTIFFSTNLFSNIDLVFEEDIENFNPKQLISIELGNGVVQRLAVDTISGDSSISRDMFFGGIKLGAEDIGLRLFLSYRPTVINSIFTHSFGIELDSMIDINQDFKFFYGLGGGVILYEIEDKNTSTDYSTDIAPYYGIETGIIYSISQKYEIEFGGRYSITNLNSESTDKSYVFDQILNWYLAFNFKY